MYIYILKYFYTNDPLYRASTPSSHPSESGVSPVLKKKNSPLNVVRNSHFGIK